MKTQLFFIDTKKHLVPQGSFINPKGFKEMFPNYELLENDERTNKTIISEKGKREDCFVIFFNKKDKRKHEDTN